MSFAFTNEELEEMAIQTVRVYLNKDFSDEYIRKKFKYALKRIINKAEKIESNSSEGITSIKEGDTTINFKHQDNAFVIDEEIKALLPSPYIRMY
jgi:hypothetical protein